MNERIKQLYDEAVNYTAAQDDGTKNQLQMNHICADKFAELIVKECYVHCGGQLMDKPLAEAHGLSYNDGVMDCAIGLLQHFGVEE